MHNDLLLKSHTHALCTGRYTVLLKSHTHALCTGRYTVLLKSHTHALCNGRYTVLSSSNKALNVKVVGFYWRPMTSRCFNERKDTICYLTQHIQFCDVWWRLQTQTQTLKLNLLWHFGESLSLAQTIHDNTCMRHIPVHYTITWGIYITYLHIYIT